MADLGIKINIRSDGAQAEKGMRAVSTELNRLESSAHSVTSALKHMGHMASMGFGLYEVASKLVGVTRQFDVLSAGLKTATGSAAGAAAAFEAIQDLAASTPYDLAQVTEAFTKLKNYGLDPSEKAIKAYGNTASALGKDLSQMIEAVADASTGEFERLKEFGIRAAKEGDSVKFTFKGVSTTVKNESDAIQGYLIKLGESNFGTAMADRMNTLDGVLSNLNDSWDALFLNISNQGIGDLIEGAARMAVDGLTGINDYLTSGQIEADLATVTNSFHGFGSDIGQAVDITTREINGYFGQLGVTGSGIASELDFAFTYHLANIRSFIQIMVVEAASAVDKVKNWWNFSETPSMAMPGKSKAAQRYAASQSGVDQARLDSITSILQENEAALNTTQALINKSQELRAQHEAERAAAQQSTTDRLAQYKNTVKGVTDVSDAEKKKAETAAKAAAKERDEIAKTIAQLQFELEVNRLSDAEKSIQLALHDKLAKAKGAERTEIESLVRQIDAETKAREAAAEAQRDEAEKAARYTDEYVRLYEKFNPKTAAIDASLKDAWSANDMGLFQGDAMALRTALEEAYKDSSTAGAEATNKAFERAIENIQDGFGTMFKSLLSGEALNSFKDFANNIKSTLIGALSQAMSTGLMNIFSGKGGNGDWMSLLAGGAMMVGNLIGNALSSSAPTRAYTAAERNTAAGIGTGALKLADSYSRDIGYAYQSTASIQFNKAAQNTGSLVAQGISAALTYTKAGHIIQAAMMDFIEPLVNVVKNSMGSIASSVQTVSSKALSGVVSKIAAVVSVLQFGYDLFTIADNKSITDHTKVTNALWALSDTLLSLSAVFASWPLAIAAGVVNTLGSISDVLENGFNQKNIMRLFLGPLTDLFFKPKPPNTWLTTGKDKTTLSGEYDPNRPTYRHDGDQSAWIGEYTPFGAVKISTQETEMNNSQMKAAFGSLLKTIKTVDTTLYDTMMRLDKAAGQAGQTMAYYYAQLNKGKRFAVNQDLEGADFGAMVKSRYAWISNLLAKSGTEVGVAFDAWFDMLNKKFLKASQKNSFQVLSVVDMLANNLEVFMDLPLSLVNVIGDSVKAIKKGRSAQEVSIEISGIIASFAIAKEGLAALGSTVSDEALVTFLANVNKLGYNVQEAGANLLGYATLLKTVNQDIAIAGDVLMATIDSKLNALKKAGLNSEQATGVFLTNNVLGSLAYDAGIAFQEADLDAVSSQLMNLAKAAQQTAKNVIEQAIADNKLGSKSYDAAVAILVKNGKLEEATVAEAEYAVALQNVAKAQVEAIGFVQQLGFVTGHSLGQIGVSFDTMNAAAQNVVKVFGDIKTAASTLDTISKTFLSPTEYAQYNLATAQRSLSNLSDSNPALAGITEDSVTAMLKSGEAMAKFIDDLAAGNGEMAKSTIEYINLLIQAKTAQQQLNEALKNLISLNSLRAGYRGAQASELQTQLSQIQGQYLDSITSLATNGASLKDQLGAIDIALSSLGDAAAKASLQIQQAFAQIYANIADKRYNLALRMAEAQGVDTSALQQQRAMELLASTSIDSQLQGIDALQAAIESRYSKELTAIKQAGDAYKQISKYVDSLKLNSQLSPLSNEARLAEARSQYQTQLAMAKAGDTEALSSITQFADTYLQEAQAFFASSTQYADIFDNVSGALKELIKPVSVDEQIQQNTSDMVDELKGINTLLDNLLSAQQGQEQQQLGQVNTDLQGASSIFNSQKSVLTSLQAALEAGTLTEADAQGIADQRLALFKSLETLFTAGLITDADRTSFSDAAKTLIEGTLSALAAGTLDKTQFDLIGMASNDLLDSVIKALSSGSWSENDTTQLTQGIASFASNLAGVLSGLVVDDADKAKLVGALSGVTDIITATLGALDISNEQKADMISAIGKGLGQLSGSIKDELATLNFSAEQLAVITGGIGTASDNLEATLSALDFSSSQQAQLKDGLTAFAANVDSALKNLDMPDAFAASLQSGIATLGETLKAMITGVDVKGVTDSLSNAIDTLSKQFPNTPPDNTAFIGPVDPTRVSASITEAELIGPSEAAALADFNSKLNTVSDLAGRRRYATGGIATEASIFGEAGPEAAVPLPDGRRIPVVIDWQRVPANTSTDNSKPIVDAINAGIDANARGQAALKAELASAREEINTLNRRLARLEVA